MQENMFNDMTKEILKDIGIFFYFLQNISPHGGAFFTFGTLLKLIPTYIPRWGGVGVYFDWCIIIMRKIRKMKFSKIKIKNKLASARNMKNKNKKQEHLKRK